VSTECVAPLQQAAADHSKAHHQPRHKEQLMYKHAADRLDTSHICNPCQLPNQALFAVCLLLMQTDAAARLQKLHETGHILPHATCCAANDTSARRYTRCRCMCRKAPVSSSASSCSDRAQAPRPALVHWQPASPAHTATPHTRTTAAAAAATAGWPVATATPAAATTVTAAAAVAAPAIVAHVTPVDDVILVIRPAASNRSQSNRGEQCIGDFSQQRWLHQAPSLPTGRPLQHRQGSRLHQP
jgi:hypothetical protein